MILYKIFLGSWIIYIRDVINRVYRNWFVGSVADLIVDGTKRDESAFDKKYLLQAE